MKGCHKHTAFVIIDKRFFRPEPTVRDAALELPVNNDKIIPTKIVVKGTAVSGN